MADNAIIQVTNWLIIHRYEVQDDIDFLKVMDEEARKAHPTFVALSDRIFNDMAVGDNIQRMMFCYVSRSEFAQIVSDRIVEFDDVIGMAQNFADFFPLPEFL